MPILERIMKSVPSDFGVLSLCGKIGKSQSQEWRARDPDHGDYLFLYDDLKNLSGDKINGHWKSYGTKESRAPFIGSHPSTTEIDYTTGILLNGTAIQRLNNMLSSSNVTDIVKRDNIINEYQKQYGNGYYTIPNLTIQKMPKTRIKKICQSNGWFSNFFL